MFKKISLKEINNFFDGSESDFNFNNVVRTSHQVILTLL